MIFRAGIAFGGVRLFIISMPEVCGLSMERCIRSAITRSFGSRAIYRWAMRD